MAGCKFRGYLTVYKTANFCDIIGVVSKTRPRAVRTFGVPILTIFLFQERRQKPLVQLQRILGREKCPMDRAEMQVVDFPNLGPDGI